MVKLNIFFQDLNDETQWRLWQTVEKELLARGEVEYKEEDETEDEFKRRLHEAVDDYINRHNQANEFYL